MDLQNYLIIYDNATVISCDEFVPGTGLASPAGINVLINELPTAKVMLDAAGVDYTGFAALLNA